MAKSSSKAPSGSRTTRKTAAPAAAPVEDVALIAAEDSAADPAAPVLRLKDLVELVVARSGIKKKDVKPVVEATLAVLGDALERGEDLNLPGLGKAHVNSQKDTGSGSRLIVRFRRAGSAGGSATAAEKPADKAAEPVQEALAEAGE